MKLSKVLGITDKKQRVCVNTKKKQKYYDSPKDVPSKYGDREIVGQRFNKETETLEFCIAKKGAEAGIKSGDWSEDINEIVNGLHITKKGSTEELESYNTDQNKDDKKDDRKDDTEERVPRRFQKNNNGRFNKNDRRDDKNDDADTDSADDDNDKPERPAHHRNNNRRKNTKPADTEE